MSDMKLYPTQSSHKFLSALLWLAAGILIGATVLVTSFAVQTPAGRSLANFLGWVFATNSVQTMWFITRAAGITGYLLIWLSVAWGLAVSNKILDTLLHRSFTYDFHQFISLLAVGFILIHMGVLLFDRYLPYTLPQVLVPFLSPYRPVWIAVGVVSFYLILLVTITFYLRGKIGMKAFRAIHVFSLLAYLGVTVHGFLSGTDSSLPAVQLMYAGSFLVVVFLTTYWFIFARSKNKKPLAVEQPVRSKTLPARR